MIKLGAIYTIRDSTHPHYWDVVFDWEDEFAKALDLNLLPVGTKYDEIYRPSWKRKALNRLNYYKTWDKYLFNPSDYKIAFHIGPPGAYSFHSRKDVIPLIIDFWKYENLQRFESIFSLSKMVFVSSREVYNYLVEKDVGVRLDHLALSLPDRLLSLASLPKKYDLIQFGRQNEIVTVFVNSLLREHPEINYVYGEKVDGKLRMISTQCGIIGEMKDRDSFLNLLRQCKVSLLSAPGMDSDSERTGGFSPVTPRFLESAACGCYMVGTFPDNADFDYYGIDKICERFTDYPTFKKAVLQCLQNEQIPSHQDFLQQHLTSVRARELKKKLSKT